MIGLIIKIIALPIGVILSNYLFGLGYTIAQALIVSLFLIIADQVLEMLLLREGTLLVSTLVDSVAVFAIIYLSQLFMDDVVVTVWGALGTTLLIALVEYFLHSYLLRTRKQNTEESA